MRWDVAGCYFPSQFALGGEAVEHTGRNIVACITHKNLFGFRINFKAIGHLYQFVCTVSNEVPADNPLFLGVIYRIVYSILLRIMTPFCTIGIERVTHNSLAGKPRISVTRSVFESMT